jgi:hypothetical protein
VAYIGKPRYSGGGDWKDHSLRPAQAKVSETLLSTNKMGMGVVGMPVVSATWDA